jgi:hypothetical protein
LILAAARLRGTLCPHAPVAQSLPLSKRAALAWLSQQRDAEFRGATGTWHSSLPFFIVDR